MNARRGKVWLVGAGPGDPGLLTLKGARAIATCEALVYDHLAARAIVDLAPPECERIDAGENAGTPSIAPAELTAMIVRLASEGKRVVRLAGGDPFAFGRGAEEAQAFNAAGVAFEIVPGVTPATAVPAYAGITLANPQPTTIVLEAMTNLAGIVGALRQNGLSDRTPVAIVREGTKPGQETLVATLATIVDEVERTPFAAPAIVVIGDAVNERETTRWFDRAPLFGKRVLITRPLAQAREFAQQVWEAGAEPLLAPTIAIGPPDDAAGAWSAVARVREYAWIVFTSRNAVEAFFDRLAAAGKDARGFGNCKIAAIGSKTAAALAAHGIAVDFVPDVFVNEAVADGLIERTVAGQRLLVYRAQEARDVISRALGRVGRAVDIVAGYKTSYVDDPTLRTSAERADIVTFTSASSVHGFVHNLADAAAVLARTTVAAIGPITASAARELGIRVDVVATEFTVEGLVQALEDAVTA